MAHGKKLTSDREKNIQAVQKIMRRAYRQIRQGEPVTINMEPEPPGIGLKLTLNMPTHFAKGA